MANTHVEDAWTPEVAEQTARALGIVLRPAHWHVLGCARELWAAGITPDLPRLARATGLMPEQVDALFPDATRTIETIAGLRGEACARPSESEAEASSSL